MKSTKVLVTLYSHPEFYPPTLNMISELSKRYEKVYVLSRNVFVTDWVYPENVRLNVTGNFVSIGESEKKSSIRKIISFLKYTWGLLKLVIKEKPMWLILCDPIPTFSYQLIRVFMNFKIKIWYHNHDVSDLQQCKKYSIGWFASKYEKRIFPMLDLFTLPSKDREKYFPINSIKGSYFFLPNYPSKSFFLKFSGSQQSSDCINLIFQGEISSGHGLEQIIPILNSKINNKNLNLILVGRISDVYKNFLLEYADKYNVADRISYRGYVNYGQLPLVTEKCHIGLAIYQKRDIMNDTIVSASNKIYEYAALGLPVLLFKSDQFTKSLSCLNWCHFSDLTPFDIKKRIFEIDSGYLTFSTEAKKSFLQDTNFEYHFSQINLH